MSTPGEWLQRYAVEPEDFDEAFTLLNDPARGLALVKDREEDPSIKEIMSGIEQAVTDEPIIATGTVSGFGEDIHIHIRPDYRVMREEGLEQPPVRAEIEDVVLKRNIIRALSRSLELRFELSSRLAKHAGDDIKQCLEASEFLAPSSRSGIAGEGVASPPSRIDCHKAHATPNGFSTHPHGDSSLFTEHGGETKPGIRIFDPLEELLRPAHIPEGYRLLTRGRHWQYSTIPENVAVLHDVLLLNNTEPRTRWVALWRAHPIVDYVGAHNPNYAERCLDAEVEAYIDHLVPMPTT